jgi:hypothetical protein
MLESQIDICYDVVIRSTTTTRTTDIPYCIDFERLRLHSSSIRIS